MGVVFDMENQKKLFTSAGKPRNQLKKVIKVWGQKLWSRFLLVTGLSGAREMFFLILHNKNYPNHHSIFLILVVTHRLLIGPSAFTSIIFFDTIRVFTKLPNSKFAIWFSCRLVKLPFGKVAEWPRCFMVHLPNGKVADL